MPLALARPWEKLLPEKETQIASCYSVTLHPSGELTAVNLSRTEMREVLEGNQRFAHRASLQSERHHLPLFAGIYVPIHHRAAHLCFPHLLRLRLRLWQQTAIVYHSRVRPRTIRRALERNRCPDLLAALRGLFLPAYCRFLPGQTPVPADAPYKNPKTPVEERVKDLLGRMTLEEKASMLAGSGWMESMPIERLGIPAIKMADGPMGVRSWDGQFRDHQRGQHSQSSVHLLPLRRGHGGHLGHRTGASAKARPSRRKSKRWAAT